MRIALAGTGPLGVTLLSAMLDSPHEVVALLRNGRVATAVGKRLLPPLAAVFAPQTSVLGLARRAKLPVFYIDRMDESELAPLRRLEPICFLWGIWHRLEAPPARTAAPGLRELPFVAPAETPRPQSIHGRHSCRGDRVRRDVS